MNKNSVAKSDEKFAKEEGINLLDKSKRTEQSESIKYHLSFEYQQLLNTDSSKISFKTSDQYIII